MRSTPAAAAVLPKCSASSRSRAVEVPGAQRVHEVEGALTSRQDPEQRWPVRHVDGASFNTGDLGTVT